MKKILIPFLKEEILDDNLNEVQLLKIDLTKREKQFNILVKLKSLIKISGNYF